jgi:hypothetical protein
MALKSGLSVEGKYVDWQCLENKMLSVLQNMSTASKSKEPCILHYLFCFLRLFGFYFVLYIGKIKKESDRNWLIWDDDIGTSFSVDDFN